MTAHSDPQRHLARLTSPEIAALDKRAGALVLPIGSLEQHGPHLSVDTDLYFTERLLDDALAALPRDVAIWRLPALPISKSNEHVGYPGTFWISAATMCAVLQDIAKGAAQSGFRRLVLWSCHGGNRSLLDVAARDIRVETGLLCFNFFPPAIVPDPVPTSTDEAALGIHAGDWETSLMLALSPDRVRAGKRNAFYPPTPPKPMELEGGAANVAWTTADLSPSGTFGDATVATAERGQIRHAVMIPKLAAALTAIATFDFTQV